MLCLVWECLGVSLPSLLMDAITQAVRAGSLANSKSCPCRCNWADIVGEASARIHLLTLLHVSPELETRAAQWPMADPIGALLHVVADDIRLA